MVNYSRDQQPKKEAKGDKGKGDKGKGKGKDPKKAIRLPGEKKAKAGKKKWSKTKAKEKLQNAVFFDKKRHDDMLKDVPKMKLITTFTISDKMKFGGNCARQSINELLRLNKIRQVGDHQRGFTIYTSVKS